MSGRGPFPAREDELLSALERHRPRPLPGRRWVRAAAVAVVLRPGLEADAPRVLLIRRPVREGDRWSGDLAFPGGLSRPGESLGETARREASEEVGLSLASPTTRLRDRVSVEPGRNRPMIVRPLVFIDSSDAGLVANPDEVAEAFFVPLRELASRGATLGRVGPRRLLAPYRPIGEHRLWGLSLSIFDELVRTLRPAGP